MKVLQPLFIFTILAASILYAKPSLASEECSNSSTTTYETKDLVSVRSRTRRAISSFTMSVYDQQIACKMSDLPGDLIWKFAISDDSELSSVDVHLYVNGRYLGQRKMNRGNAFRFKFSPKKVQDYRFEFKNAKGSGTIYLLE